MAARKLDCPAKVEELYDAVHGEVEPARPIMPGDVYRDIRIDGLDEKSGLVMVMQHPCSMRRTDGRQHSKLRDRLTVVRVSDFQVVPLNEWADKCYDYFPLPGLSSTSREAACFRDIGTVKTHELHPDRRIAIMSESGLLHLLQRQTHHFTRTVVDLPTLRTSIEAVLEETEIQEAWAEAALASTSNTDVVSVITQVEIDFQSRLGPGESEERAALKDPLG